MGKGFLSELMMLGKEVRKPMQLGVLTVLFQDKPLEEMLDIVQEFGLDAIELGTGNYPGNAHCNPDELLSDAPMLRRMQDAIAAHGLVVSALSCQGNPLHPRLDVARQAHDVWRKTVLLAERTGIRCINVFSGCPGDSDTASAPNWVTCAWPPDYERVLQWQWQKKLIPYWQDEARFAENHGVQQIAFEMHPGFMVYNPETLMRLREAVGSQIGANFDPSHLIWQGIEPVAAIRYLGERGALFHFHAKDVALAEHNIHIQGVLDTKSYAKIPERSWTFRTVGYGQTEMKWKNMISALRLVGYDGVLSIEHEDAMMSPLEGFRRSVELLKRCVVREPAGSAWWVGN
ncbi:xylose isomerase-like TIM barrel [Peptococcaceae bacterium CEB3]|nr:xylose isomerase-like TIM barrel [Peptococcaceae bacterium CEB3]